MEIKVEKYLSEDEMKTIAAEAFRSICAEKLEKDGERIITNAAYDAASKIVSDTLGASMDEIIAEKALKVIDGLSDYTVFRCPDVWDRGASPAYTLLMKCITANEEAISNRISELIKGLDDYQVFELIKDKKVQFS